MSRSLLFLLLLLPLVSACGGAGGTTTNATTPEATDENGSGGGSNAPSTPTPTPTPTPLPTSEPSVTPTPAAPDSATIGFAFFAPNPVTFGGSSSFNIKIEEVSDPTRMKELHWSNAATGNSGAIAIDGTGFSTPAYLSADIPAVAFPGSYTVEGWIVMKDGTESNHVTATVTVTL